MKERVIASENRAEGGTTLPQPVDVVADLLVPIMMTRSIYNSIAVNAGLPSFEQAWIQFFNFVWLEAQKHIH